MNISLRRAPPDSAHAASRIFIFTDCPRELPIQAPETQLAFRQRAQRNVFRCRDERRQSEGKPLKRISKFGA